MRLRIFFLREKMRRYHKDIYLKINVLDNYILKIISLFNFFGKHLHIIINMCSNMSDN